MSQTPSPAVPLRIALVAGEASGDLLGAGLIAELRRRHPDAVFGGIGGDAMRAAGLDVWHDAQELAVMGLVEVLRHLPRLLRLRRHVMQRLLTWRPQLFIGIDAPDFNLSIERRLKTRGIRTVHYVSPSVWAWRQGRAAKIGRSADRVLCLFPMEPPIYARHGVDARFVGHPLAELFAMSPDRETARQGLGISSSGMWLALLPGSRLGEIARLGPIFLAACVLVRRRFPELGILAPMANEHCGLAFKRLLDGIPPRLAGTPVGADEWQSLRRSTRLLDGDSHRCMVAADAILLASGTAALEAMLAKRPLVVAYRIAPLTHFIVKSLGLLKIDRFSLPNVLAGATIVPEIMQKDCTPERLATTVAELLDHPNRVNESMIRFCEIHAALRQGASQRAADAVDELLFTEPG